MTLANPELTYENAVFAGGGSRCFWQLGFWKGATEAGVPLTQTVQYAASTSAGCIVATAALLDRTEEALTLFKSYTAANPSNIHWHNLKPGSNGRLLPHMDMFLRAANEFLSPEDLQRLSSKRLEFLVTRIPGLWPGALAAMVAFVDYGLDKRITGSLHPSWTQRLGFEPRVWSNQDALDLDDFIAMMMASSSVPPVLPSPPFRGDRVLDGGIIDNVPAHLADGRSGKTLVLLSKRYRHPLPKEGVRTYVQPSRAITLDKFNYADPVALQAVYDLGFEDGGRWASAHG